MSNESTLDNLTVIYQDRWDQRLQISVQNMPFALWVLEKHSSVIKLNIEDR